MQYLWLMLMLRVVLPRTKMLVVISKYLLESCSGTEVLLYILKQMNFLCHVHLEAILWQMPSVRHREFSLDGSVYMQRPSDD